MANTINAVTNPIKNWWIPILIGAIMLGASGYLFTQPESGYEALSWIFSVLFLVIGLFQVIFSITNSDSLKGWGWYLALGIVTAVCGVYLISEPEMAQVSLAIFVALVFLFMSIGAISTSLDVKEIGAKGWGWMMLLGVLGMVFSFFLFRRLDIGAMTLVGLTAINFAILGVFFIYFGFQLNKIRKAPQKLTDEVKKQIQEVQNQLNEAQAKVKDAINQNVNAS